jgi:NAD(P)-dependent dehydrogenase (short-subunit alcohol dehydrogenase family)
MAVAGTGKRSVVVTGANSGIGRALAARLVDGGHLVIGVDRVVDALPAGVVGVECDLADASSTEVAARAAADLVDQLGGGSIDGLASVAGVPGTAPVATVLRVNLVGLRRLTELLIPRVAADGSIVLVSSLAGYQGPASPAEVAELLALSDDGLVEHAERAGLDGPTAYQLSKQLVHRYALDLCARLHPRGIRCNSVSPGPVETPILQDFQATMPSLDLAGAMVGRHGRPEEVAAAAAFLLSPDASWVNGVDLRLDGGLGALRAAEESVPST